jgi:hypothetical protein
MLISELQFSHLREEQDARLARELEQRRVIEERLEEQRATGAGPNERSRARRRQFRGFGSMRPLRGA